jgi:hypothetical protein
LKNQHQQNSGKALAAAYVQMLEDEAQQCEVAIKSKHTFKIRHHFRGLLKPFHTSLEHPKQ